MSTFTNAKTAIKFKGSSYKRKADGPTLTFEDVSLETALVSIVKSKRIVRSEIAGKDGDVIEHIGAAAHEITIVGTITSDFGIEPVAKVNALNAVIDAPLSIQVICPFLNSKGVHKIIITDSTLPQDPGGISYQTFTINAISEIPIELRVQNG